MAFTWPALIVLINPSSPVQGLEFRVWGLGFEVQDLECGVSGRTWPVRSPSPCSSDRVEAARCLWGTVSHPRVDAGQSQKSIPLTYMGELTSKVNSHSPFTLSMAPTAEPNCSSKDPGWGAHLACSVSFSVLCEPCSEMSDSASPSAFACRRGLRVGDIYYIG